MRSWVISLAFFAAFSASADTRFRVAIMPRPEVQPGKGQCDIRLSVDNEVEITIRRDQVVVCEGDPADYIFLVVDGVVRSCRTFQSGTRNILGFYFPGELFGSTDQKHVLSVEAASDAMILYLKCSALLSIAARDSRVASFLLAVTTSELRRAQEHALLIGRSAKSRVATFLLDMSRRLGKTKYLDLPMSHQDIADHLGLTIETISRTITELERLQLVARLSPRTLVLLNRPSLSRIKN